MAVAEAITNIAAAPHQEQPGARFGFRPTGWRPRDTKGEDANLFDTVKAVGDEHVPGARRSRFRSARIRCHAYTRWQDDGEEYQVVAPVSLIVSAFAPVTDVTQHLTPQLQTIDEPSYLLLFDRW